MGNDDSSKTAPTMVTSADRQEEVTPDTPSNEGGEEEKEWLSQKVILKRTTEQTVHLEKSAIMWWFQYRY